MSSSRIDMGSISDHILSSHIREASDAGHRLDIGRVFHIVPRYAANLLPDDKRYPLRGLQGQGTRQRGVNAGEKHQRAQGQTAHEHASALGEH